MIDTRTKIIIYMETFRKSICNKNHGVFIKMRIVYHYFPFPNSSSFMS